MSAVTGDNKLVPTHLLEKQEIREVLPEEQKVRGLFLRTVQSPLFWMVALTTAGTAGLITFSALILTGVIGIPLAVLIPVAGLGLAILGITICVKRYKFFYEFSINQMTVKSFFGCYPWYHEILPQLVLGAIPLKNKEHDNALQKENVAAILSMVQEFETTDPSILTDPVSEASWKAQEIDYMRLETPDCGAPTPEQITIAVAYIHENIKAVKKTYVHCKAGVGRSAMIVVCYLLKHQKDKFADLEGNDPVAKAIAFVKSKRPQINLSSVQKSAVYAYAATLQNLNSTG